MHPLEKAPSMPADLAADLADRFAPKQAPVKATSSTSWFEKVRGLLASPSFGVAAAAIVMVGVAVPMLSGPEAKTSETFRGADMSALVTDSVKIVLVGDNDSLRTQLQSSDSFETSAFIAHSDPSSAANVPGPKVVVNFDAGTVSAIDFDGTVLHSATIEGNDIASAVATAVSYL